MKQEAIHFISWKECWLCTTRLSTVMYIRMKIVRSNHEYKCIISIINNYLDSLTFIIIGIVRHLYYHSFIRIPLGINHYHLLCLSRNGISLQNQSSYSLFLFICIFFFLYFIYLLDCLSLL